MLKGTQAIQDWTENRDTWIEREALAEAMIPLIGRLYRRNNVVTSIHGRSLIGKSTINILMAHRFARRITTEELSLEDTAPILGILADLDLGAAARDLGRLRLAYDLVRTANNGAALSLEDFVRTEFADIVGQSAR